MKKVLFLFIALVFSFNSLAFEAVVPEGLSLSDDSKIYGATFPSTFLLYIFAPEMLAGWNGPFYEHEKKYIDEKYKNLPMLGGWWEGGRSPNKETLINAGIGAAFVFDMNESFASKTAELFDDINIPCVILNTDRMDDYGPLFTTLGKILHKEEKGRVTAEYVKESLARVDAMTADIKENEKKKVYLALDNNGLKTRCAESAGSELISRAGGINVYKCGGKPDGLYQDASMEQIIVFDPDVIVAVRKEFYDSVKKDRRWSKLRAVKNGNVILMPREPFSWLDKPATFMRFIAVQYLACGLYPERCDVDIKKETARFLEIFMDYKASPERLDDILNQAG